MRTITIISTFLFFAYNLYAQARVYVPNYIDQAQKSELYHSYLIGFPIVVENEKVVSILSDNGMILKDSVLENRYICIPHKLGNCVITITTLNDQNRKSTIRKDILVIEKPKLEFLIRRISIDSNKVFYSIVDSTTGKDVLKDYHLTFFSVELIKNNSRTGYLMDTLNGLIDFENLSNQSIEIKDYQSMVIELYLFGNQTDLFALHTKQELKIHP